jgi:hypothetical protein
LAGQSTKQFLLWFKDLRQIIHFGFHSAINFQSISNFKYWLKANKTDKQTYKNKTWYIIVVEAKCDTKCVGKGFVSK